MKTYLIEGKKYLVEGDRLYAEVAAIGSLDPAGSTVRKAEIWITGKPALSSLPQYATKKDHIAALLNEGKKTAEICDIVGCKKFDVYNLKSLLKRTGKLKTAKNKEAREKRAGGGKTKLLGCMDCGKSFRSRLAVEEAICPTNNCSSKQLQVIQED